MARVKSPPKNPAAGDTPRRSPRLRTSTPIRRHAPPLNFPSPASTIPNRSNSSRGISSTRGRDSTTMIESYLIEIERHDDGREFAIPQAPVHRLIKELTNRDGILWSARAKKAIHCAAEDFLVGFFDKIQFLAYCSGSGTIHLRHLTAARYIMGV